MKPLKMDFNEFVTWSTGYVLMGIGQGRRLGVIMHDVVDNAARNEVFGDNIHLRLQEVIKGCSGCDHDAGGVWNHCDDCRFRVTREVVKIVNGE